VLGSLPRPDCEKTEYQAQTALLQCPFPLTQRVKRVVSRFALAFQHLLDLEVRERLESSNEEQHLAHATGLHVKVVCLNGKHLREVGAAKGVNLTRPG